MRSNGVVSIRVEALGVSITIADGSIAIEQTAGTALPGFPRDSVKGLAARTEASTVGVAPESESQKHFVAIPKAASAVITEEAPLPNGGDDSGVVVRDRSAEDLKPRPGTRLHAAPFGQTKPVWSDEEVEKLKALWPDHSASAIAKQLGRGRNAVRSKIQNLGLKKPVPPTVIANSSPREAKPARKPRSLSAAATEEPEPAGTATALRAVRDGFGAVSLFDHRPGQCRWIISDVWPVMYCGAPVVDSSSWCEQHSRRVFTGRTAPVGRFRLKGSGLAW